MISYKIYLPLTYFTKHNAFQVYSFCCRWKIFILFYDRVVFHPEKAMAPHSSTLAWKIPWMEEPGGLQSMGSLRVGHDWATSLSLFTFLHWRRKWQPTPVFLPGESQGWGSLLSMGLHSRTRLSDLAAAAAVFHHTHTHTHTHKYILHIYTHNTSALSTHLLMDSSLLPRLSCCK